MAQGEREDFGQIDVASPAQSDHAINIGLSLQRPRRAITQIKTWIRFAAVIDSAANALFFKARSHFHCDTAGFPKEAIRHEHRAAIADVMQESR